MNHDDRLELSARDLKLEANNGLASTGRDLLVSITRGFNPTPPTNNESVRRTTKVALDDPDELFLLTRRNELRRTRNWILPIINATIYLARLCSPIVRLRNQNRLTAGFLRPGPLFYWTQVPVFVGGAVFVVSSLTPVLRGTSTIQKGTNITFALALAASIVWQWTFGHKAARNLTVALAASAIWLTLCLITHIQIAKQRRNNLIGVWQFPLRTSVKLRDFWLVEIHATFETIWATFVAVITANYYVVHGKARPVHTSATGSMQHGYDEYSEILATRMVAAALISILVITAGACFAFTTKRRGSCIVALAAAYFLLDAALCFNETPNAYLQPQLAWIDPTTLGKSFKIACFIAAFSFASLFTLSAILHCFYAAGLARTLSIDSSTGQKSRITFMSRYFHSPQSYKDWDSNSLPTVMGRKPSEFLMRSSSSLTEDDDNLTPIRKK